MSKFIKQCRLGTPNGIQGQCFVKSHSLSPYIDKREPTIFYGLVTLHALRKHKGLAIVVWRGSDILKTLKDLPSLRNNPNVKHVAISSFIAKDLKKAGLKYKFIPVASREMTDFKPCLLGKEIYAYAPNHEKKYIHRYGLDILDEVKKKCKYNINISRSSTHFSKSELIEVYKRCFCGFRFTRHDGLPNQVVEMGCMGRKSFYNGGLPGSIKWDNNISNILENIEKEAESIGKTNHELPEKMKKYIDIEKDWMKIDFWT